MTVVATVGTTHPLAFAGLSFALLALAEVGIRPVCVVAGVSAQSATRVLARAAVEPSAIAAQFAALRDAGVAAFHVGALLGAEAVHAVGAGLAEYPGVPVVVDPVLAASGGDALADDAARLALRDVLLPRATLVTPNLDETSALLERDVRDVPAMRVAAREFVTRGAHAALVKGGHLTGDAVDVYDDGERTIELVAPRIDATLRGTGDLLAVTIAAQLGAGVPMHEAIERARRRVRNAIARGEAFAGTRVTALRAAAFGRSAVRP